MKLSIVLPVYGVEKYIEKCAVSLFSQTTTEDVEFVFVNDATKDNSMLILKDVIQKFDDLKDKVHIINHKCNQGLAAARLTGLLAAKGDYIWLMDSDDWVEPDSIETIMKSLDVSPDVLYFNYFRNSKDEQQVNVDKYYPTLLNCLCIRFTLCVWRMVVKRDIFIKNKCLPIPGIDMSEDIVLHSRIRYYFSSVIVLDKPLYHYRIDNTNSYVNNVGAKQMTQIVEGVKAISAFYKVNDFSRNIRRCIAYKALTTYSMVSQANEELYRSLSEILKDTSSILYISFCFLRYNKSLCSFFANLYRKVLIPCK